MAAIDIGQNRCFNGVSADDSQARGGRGYETPCCFCYLGAVAVLSTASAFAQDNEVRGTVDGYTVINC